MSGKHYIGIDIGGSKIAIGFFGKDPGVLGKVVLPTCATEPFGHAFARMVPAIDRLCTGHGLSGMPDGIGIGCTGPVDVRRGLVRNPYTLPGWPDAPLVEAFASRYGCPVRLENDADTALIGELVSREECRKVKNALMLTFGTGVGSAVLRSGAILRGEDFSHPELGHLLVSEAVSSCYCGGSGCLESLASGPALHEAARELGFASLDEVFTRPSGEARSRLVGAWALHVTRALWALVATLSPEVVLFGGGVADCLYPHAKDIITQGLSSGVFLPPTRVKKAMHGNDAGMVGAAALVSGLFPFS